MQGSLMMTVEFTTITFVEHTFSVESNFQSSLTSTVSAKFTITIG
jgi:hypothetical protein